ncbi:MAG: hypothetical protein L0211_27240 [Planctomycetaceae bacterium]|nr:hypothetical protein [Planctomycetaceae bacterium]
MAVSLLLAGLLILGQAADKGASNAPPANAPSTDAELAKNVKRLVLLLDDEAQVKREAAEKELVALGADVLPHLPSINASTLPAEMQNRLRRVRAALMKTAVAATTKTVLVSLAGEMPLSKAIAELTRQSGNPLVDYREKFNQEPRDPSIKVDLKDVPFWQAFDTVLDAAGLSVYEFDEEKGALAYVARGDGALPRIGKASYSGLFRMEPARIEAVRDLKNPENRSLKLFVEAAWEPRVRPIVIEQPLDELSALDEAGNAVLIDGSEGKLEVPVETNNSAVELEIPFLSPDRSVKQIASIKGKLDVVCLGRVESFEFADIDKLKTMELERGGATVVVDSFRKNGDIYEVNMRVTFDKASNALESHRGWIYNNECYLLDPKKNRIDNVGVEATLIDDNAVGLSYKFDLGENTTPKGHAFVYKTAAAIIRVPVEFELKGIDLP